MMGRNYRRLKASLPAKVIPIAVEPLRLKMEEVEQCRQAYTCPSCECSLQLKNDRLVPLNKTPVDPKEYAQLEIKYKRALKLQTQHERYTSILQEMEEYEYAAECPELTLVTRPSQKWSLIKSDVEKYDLLRQLKSVSEHLTSIKLDEQIKFNDKQQVNDKLVKDELGNVVQLSIMREEIDVLEIKVKYWNLSERLNIIVPHYPSQEVREQLNFDKRAELIEQRISPDIVSAKITTLTSHLEYLKLKEQLVEVPEFVDYEVLLMKESVYYGYRFTQLRKLPTRAVLESKIEELRDLQQQHKVYEQLLIHYEAQFNKLNEVQDELDVFEDNLENLTRFP